MKLCKKKKNRTPLLAQNIKFILFFIKFRIAYIEINAILAGLKLRYGALYRFAPIDSLSLFLEKKKIVQHLVGCSNF